MNETPTEEEVRGQRDRVYGHKISDEEWNTCKVNWMKPAEIAWLYNQRTLYLLNVGK